SARSTCSSRRCPRAPRPGLLAVGEVAGARAHGHGRGGYCHRAVGLAHRDLHVVRARLAEGMLRGETTLERAPRLEGRAVRLVHALAAVVPVPLDLGAVER